MAQKSNLGFQKIKNPDFFRTKKKCPQNCDGSTSVTIVVILELECIVWNELQKLAAHYSKSLIFCPKSQF